MSASFDVALKTARALQLDVPEALLAEHAPVLGQLASLLEMRRPLRVLESGTGELADADARLFSQLGATLAEKTGGAFVACTRSDAGFRFASELPRGTRSVLGHSEIGSQPFDVVFQHPVLTQNEPHPLHTFWAVLTLEPSLAQSGLLALTRCDAGQGNRAEYVREYFDAIGSPALAYGNTSVWHKPPRSQAGEIFRSHGQLAAFSEGTRLTPDTFLRLYDQLFAPLLRSRAGTFRAMFQHLLSRPPPYVIVETGTTRESGDFGSNGQSTVLFDLVVNTFGGKVISIDIDPSNLLYCRGRTSERTTQLCSDSVKALHALPEVAEADLVYLDSYDFDESRPHPSSLHHLKELAAIWGRTKKGCLLVIDDCFGPDHGKHAYVSRFLASQSQAPIFAGYQTGWVL